MRGILLIAIGHPMYTHMAYNLAVSIRSHSDIHITLAHEGAGLSFLFDDQKKVFDNFISVPEKMFTENGKRESIKAKTFIYDLSPYDETIFLDADMIFSPYKKIENLFVEMQGNKLQFACRGEKKMNEHVKSEWMSIEDVKNKYGYEHLYDISSEFIYFKKCDEVKKVFDDAIKLYSSHGLTVTKFGEGIPDEVPFSLSLEKNNFKILSPYCPTYWQPQYFNKITPDEQVMQNYYAISTGGAHVQPNIKRIYDKLARHFFAKMKINRVPYQLMAKSTILPERKKI